MPLFRAAKLIKQKLKTAKNKSLLDFCGPGAEIRGTIEKRHPQSYISVGEKSRIDGYVVTELATSRVSIGKNTLVGPNTIIDCVSKVTIGDNVLISYECVFSDSDNHSLSYSKRKNDLENWRLGQQDWTAVNTAPILVNRGAWIGARAIILKGVTIGEGAVVGMGSVVTRDVPPFTVVAGNPAKEIRKLPEESL